MRRNLAHDRHSGRIAAPGAASGATAGARQHPDGHVVELRALPDYDALFGVDFTPTTLGPVTPMDPPTTTPSPTEASQCPPHNRNPPRDLPTG
jgi:hypothetical protein